MQGKSTGRMVSPCNHCQQHWTTSRCWLSETI